MQQASNSLELLYSIRTEDLYVNLVKQLNKDFQLANLDMHFDTSISVKDLKEELSDVLLKLLTEQYDSYLNFLYRVDVPESDLIKIRQQQLPEIIDEVAFIVLKRLFQKVWIKHHFDKN